MKWKKASIDLYGFKCTINKWNMNIRQIYGINQKYKRKKIIVYEKYQ